MQSSTVTILSATATGAQAVPSPNSETKATSSPLSFNDLPPPPPYSEAATSPTPITPGSPPPYKELPTPTADDSDPKESKSPASVIDKEVKITIESKIQEGEFGAVFKGTWNGQAAAVKIFNLPGKGKTDPKNVVNEVFLNQTAGSGAIRCFGSSYTVLGDDLVVESRICIGMELADGDLFDYSSERELSIFENLGILRQVSYNLSLMHESEIIHGDIKPENILRIQANVQTNSASSIDNSIEAQYKFADFGASVKLTPGETFKIQSYAHGTLGYRAPEVIHERKFSKQSDILAFGKVIYTQFERAEVSDDPKTMPFFFTPRQIQPWVLRCWDHNPANRPSATELTAVFDKAYAEFNPKRCAP